MKRTLMSPRRLTQLALALSFAAGALTLGAAQSEAARVVVKVRAGQPARARVVVARPVHRKVWVPGHWQYSRARDVRVWVPGHWKVIR